MISSHMSEEGVGP